MSLTIWQIQLTQDLQIAIFEPSLWYTDPQSELLELPMGYRFCKHLLHMSDWLIPLIDYSRGRSRHRVVCHAGDQGVAFASEVPPKKKQISDDMANDFLLDLAHPLKAIIVSGYLDDGLHIPIVDPALATLDSTFMEIAQADGLFESWPKMS